MSAVAFDTLKYAKTLEDAGVPANQAEAQAKALAEAMETNLVTKQDLKVEIHELKVDIIKWMVGLLFAQTALIVALIKILH